MHGSHYRLIRRCFVILMLTLCAVSISAGDTSEFGGKWTGNAAKRLTLPQTPQDHSVGTHRAPYIYVSTNFIWDRVFIRSKEHIRGSLQDSKILQVIPVTGAVSDVAVADFNNDGVADLAIADFLESSIDVYIAQHDGTYRHNTRIKVGPGPMRISTKDFNGDKKADISSVNYHDRTISRASGRGDGRFNMAITMAFAGNSQSAPYFAGDAGSAVDYSEINNAISTGGMSRATKQHLLRYSNRSERFYKANNIRKAVSSLESFIKFLKYCTDPTLTGNARAHLKELAIGLINQLLNGGLSVTLNANPSTIELGESTTLIWASHDAVSAVIDNDIGSVDVNGSTSVNPILTTTYTIEVTDADGLKASDSDTVTVTGTGNSIYVNASLGNDTTGIGSLANPYKTITKGLSVATIGKVVVVAKGLYDESLGEVFPLTIPAGVKVIGAGWSRTFVEGGGPIPETIIPVNHPALGVTANIPAVFEITGTIVAQNNTTLGSLTLQGGASMGVFAYESSISVKNCKISGYLGGGPSALSQLVGNRRTTVDGPGEADDHPSISTNTISGIDDPQGKGYGYGGALTAIGGESIEVKNCTVSGSAEGIFVIQSSVLALDHTTVTSNYDNGVVLVSGGIHFSSLPVDRAAFSLNVVGCTFSANGEDGFEYFGEDPIVIDGQTFLNNQYTGIDSDTRAVCTYSNNLFTAASADDAIDDIGDATISNNTIRGNFDDALDYIYDATITGNSLTDCNIGIFLDGTGSPTVTNNTIRNCRIGIDVGGGASPRLRSNIFRDCWAAGVWIDSSAGRVDLGVHGDFGNNVFHNLNKGMCNLFNESTTIISNAIGNTWDHGYAYSDFSCAPFPSFNNDDIQGCRVGPDPNVIFQ